MLAIPCAPLSAQYSPLNERAGFCLFWLIIVLIIAPTLGHRPPIEWQSTSTPSSRSKGEVVCYSCFSKDFAALSDSRSLGRNQMPFKPASNNANATDDEDMSEIFEILREGGMMVPTVAERCADTPHTANPNFQGAKLRPCTNSKQDPGACVKFKGYYKEKISKMTIDQKEQWSVFLEIINGHNLTCKFYTMSSIKKLYTD
ncbi:hypothetical protein DdX_13392 [Ditylenchus destructor]|uniref:Uncharacterized protein n=1 Tax=Ditylenchus destructor TaxID=166010 RepID=A0AAD4QWJ2_9BILA|nr:hypothetical protein DdX_13392 [Ditylenchus destructor]